MSMWGGRFEGDASPLFRALNDSLPFDARLAREDIAGSRAWASALTGAGVLTADEHATLDKALTDLDAKVTANPRLPLESYAEDIHSWVEGELVSALGPLGKKLHTGRSRNDQVATDLRLWTRTAIDTRLAELTEVRRAMLDLAERECTTPMPAYTHLQRAQPVTVGHWALAYCEMFERDAERLADAQRRVNVCPLGSGALAGTTFPVDRDAIARDLGFDRPTRNSLDSVSDRDFVVETIAACALTALHLSRLGEELVFFASGEAGFIKMSDAVTSGSSLMPQKKNPDAAELLRGKAGRILGNLVAIAATLKNLPLAYNKDLQEDKEPLFDAVDHLALCLQVTPIILDGLTVNRDRLLAAAKAGHANATELADALVAKGIPFRDAHDLAGKAVRVALDRNCNLEDLPLADLQAIAPELDESIFEKLALESVLGARSIAGGTSPTRVAEALLAARQRLGAAQH